MSILRLAIIVAITAFANHSAIAQNFAPDCNTNDSCGCNRSNRKCLPADQLWAGFAENQGCKGCVKLNRLSAPGFGGVPACGLNGCGNGCGNGCATRFNLHIPVPSMSINWPRPCQLIQPRQPQPASPGCDCQSSIQPMVKPLNILPKLQSQPRQVRCDIQNDHFGKLGESRAATQFSTIRLPQVEFPAFKRNSQRLPSAIGGDYPVQTAVHQDENIPGPPKPVIDSEELQRVEPAQHLDYGAKAFKR